MNFEKEAGERITRYVAAVGNTGKLNFGVEFLKFDSMLYEADRAAMTPEERDRADEFASWDMCDSYNVPRDEPDRRFRSMRIYHVSGEAPGNLKVDDAWECEVVKCYLNPNETLTRDGRRRIHFTLRPIARNATEKREVDVARRMYIVTELCGRNVDRRETSCDISFKYYRDEGGLWAYRVRETMVHGTVVKRDPILTRSANEYMVEVQEKNGASMDTRRLRRMYRDLPVVPSDRV